ncbi:MAG: hypothetical protein KGI80_00720 [Verrucomicrobiota bacterium]|nr:hypothetical protein [Verrucomicrobiota bacterium]
MKNKRWILLFSLLVVAGWTADQGMSGDPSGDLQQEQSEESAQPKTPNAEESKESGNAPAASESSTSSVGSKKKCSGDNCHEECTGEMCGNECCCTPTTCNCK